MGVRCIDEQAESVLLKVTHGLEGNERLPHK